MPPWSPLYPHPLEGLVLCNCKQPAKILTTKKEGPNLGRQFFMCSKGYGEPGRCTYWKWADELMNQGAPLNYDSSQSTLTATPSSSPDNAPPSQQDSALTSTPTIPSTPTLNRAIRAPSGGDIPTPPPTTPRRRVAPLTPFQEARRRHLIHHALTAPDPDEESFSIAAPHGVDKANPRASTLTATKTDIDLARIHPWPAVTPQSGRIHRVGQSRPRSGSSTASSESGSDHKRRRTERDDWDDELNQRNPFIAGPSHSHSGGTLFRDFNPPTNKNTSLSHIEVNGRRVSELERRLNELEQTHQTQANLIQSQAELIARSEQTLQAVESTNRILQARIDRLERHAAETESLVAAHDRILFGDDSINGPETQS